MIVKIMYLQTFFCLSLVQFSGCLSNKQTKCSLKLRYSEIPAQMMELTQLPLEYSCPRDFDPKSFTECCNDGDCCEPGILTIAPIDDQVLMITGIIVITTCLTLTVLSVICCFWSKCPMYNTCRPSYTTSNVIVYSLAKEDPIPLMPAEGNKGVQYKPLSVKIKKVIDV